MGLFKKLQENSLYWRYRFITRRWLAMRGWWRRRGRPQNAGRIVVTPLRSRGMAAANPYARGMTDRTRGIAFVLALAAVWTVLSLSTIPQDGLLIGILRIASLVGVAYLFVRFW